MDEFNNYYFAKRNDYLIFLKLLITTYSSAIFGDVSFQNAKDYKIIYLKNVERYLHLKSLKYILF